MNSSSLLLLLVFAAIGYVAHPVILPKLTDSKLILDSASAHLEKLKLQKKDDDGAQEEVRPNLPPKAEAPDVKEENLIVRYESETLKEIEAPQIIQEAEEAQKAEINIENLISELQRSVKNGDIKEFGFIQVLKWEITGEEEFGGTACQVGMVTYEANTIFNTQTLKAKALIRNGKVIKWLWPSTNAEMK